MRKILIIMMIFTSITLGATKSVYRYVQELKGLTEQQALVLVFAFESGVREDLSLTLASIVWKESSFGQNTINDNDGKYGSFGLAQILLSTSASRHNVKTKRGLKRLRLKLLNDHNFNLSEAVAELTYWRKVYKNNGSKYWFTLMLASYNAGWKGIRSSKGKAYAQDVLQRIKALKAFFSDERNFKNSKPLARKYFMDIRSKLIKNKVISTR